MREILPQDYSQLEQLVEKLFSNTTMQSVERLGGLTNHTYAVTLDLGKYVFRLPGEGTEELINRKDEKVSNELACAVGVDTPLIYFSPESGVKVAGYIDHAVTMSPESMRESRNIAAAADLLHKLHTCGKNTGVPFDVFEMANGYEALIRDNHGSFYKDYPGVRQAVMEIKEKIDRYGVPKAPCHNDPLCENWVRDLQRMYLIDWEYAGMNDPLWDLADLSIEAEYDPARDTDLLEAYFGRNPEGPELLRFEANKVFLDFLWTLWGKTRVPFEGEPMEEYAAARYARLKQNLNMVTR